jgi:hypothetical protein
VAAERSRKTAERVRFAAGFLHPIAAAQDGDPGDFTTRAPG